MSDRERRVEALAPWIAGALLACPVLVAFYPPMTDLPFHEAAIGILRHFGDAAMFPRGLYERNLGEPNQLFHMAGWALSLLVSTRWAVKILVAASVTAVPVCAARFARHVGASPLASLVVAPIALGWLFSWGLVTNLLGLAALLALLPVADRHAARPTARSLGAVATAVVLLYFAHEAMMFAYAGAVMWLATLHRGSIKALVLRLAPFALAVALTFAEQVYWHRHLMTPAVASVPVVWHSLGHKLERLPYMIAPATDPLAQIAVSVLCVGAAGSLFALRLRERRRDVPGHDAASANAARAEVQCLARAQSWAREHRWELFSAAAFLAYLAFPFTLSGATLVYERWFPLAFATLAVVVAPRDPWTAAARIPRALVLAVPVATLLVAWPPFVDSNAQYEAFERLLPHIEPGSAVASLELGPRDPDRGYSLATASGRILATRGGRLGYAFTDSPISPAVIAPRYQWQESLLRLGFDPWSFRPGHDLRRYRYVLLRSSDPAMLRGVSAALSADTRFVARAGAWVLLESTLPVVPPASPDAPMEIPPPESLRDVVRAMLAR